MILNGWDLLYICCVFSFHKHPSAINLDSGFRHRFMCHVETDLGCVSPLFESSISEARVQNHQRSSFGCCSNRVGCFQSSGVKSLGLASDLVYE
jgi:hypothetical protein